MTDAYVIHEPGGTITVAASAIADVVARAVEEVDGASLRRRRRRLHIDVDGDRARVELELAARYGEVLPELAQGVQQGVAAALSAMCGLRIDAVDVAIEELEAP
jgi:uncharacterized alkaline shock family protein YloU